MFLSKAELDYLTSKQQFSDGYSLTIKSRLQKKVERFASEELPLLIGKGLIPSSILDASCVTKFRNGSVTENCNNVERGDSMLQYRHELAINDCLMSVLLRKP
jgi:hypothetical protein